MVLEVFHAWWALWLHVNGVHHVREASHERREISARNVLLVGEVDGTLRGCKLGSRVAEVAWDG